MTGNIDRAAELRLRLARRLANEGHLRSDVWRRAVETVPRELFVPIFFRHRANDEGFSEWEPVSAQSSDCLDEVYDDESLVTQLDGRLGPLDVTAATAGVPTSSATMPSLVVRMWENLRVDDDSQVAEVGTGTGYSTALGCARLGSNAVTSVDVDKGVVERAQQALDRAGFFPRLQTLDALDGLPEPPPGGYDRVIATCSMRHVPLTWLGACRPGGSILLTLSGWLDGSALVRLEVEGSECARGRLLDDPATFMPARRHAAPGVAEFGTADDEELREVVLGIDMLDSPVGRFVAQLAAPMAQRVRSVPGEGEVDYLVDVGKGSYAAIERCEGRTIVRQGGPDRIWDNVEAAWTAWRDAGSPSADVFTFEITPEGQSINLHSSKGSIRWMLPTNSS